MQIQNTARTWIPFQETVQRPTTGIQGRGNTLSVKKLYEQKEADIKQLEEEYEAKITQLKQAMDDSIGYIDRQMTAKKELQKQHLELATQLKKSKSSTKQLKMTCYELKQNMEKQLKTKNTEIEELVLAKKEIIQNYSRRNKRKCLFGSNFWKGNIALILFFGAFLVS